LQFWKPEDRKAKPSRGCRTSACAKSDQALVSIRPKIANRQCNAQACRKNRNVLKDRIAAGSTVLKAWQFVSPEKFSASTTLFWLRAAGLAGVPGRVNRKASGQEAEAGRS
jgi:hypothetical protein